VTIIEYTLEDGRVPNFVADGGFWVNPDGSGKMIGVGLEGSIPDSLTKYTLEGLQARQLAIHANYPMMKIEIKVIDGDTIDVEEEMTDDEVNATIKEWVDARS